MNNRIKLIAYLLTFVLVIAAAYFGYQALRDHIDGGLNLQTFPTVPTQSDQTDVLTSQTDLSSSQTDVSSADEKPVYAADFTVYDLSGTAHTLSSFRGKPIVLNFWASWCPPCKEEMPDFEQVYRDMGDDVQFLMIDVVDGEWETVEQGQAFIEENDFTFPVYFDTDEDAAYNYSIRSIPTTYFINADGIVIAGSQGMIDEEVLRQGIDMILPAGSISQK